MMVYAHNNTKIIVEQTPLEVSVSPGLKKSNISLDQSFIEFEEYPDTFLDSLLNFEGWVEDHQNPSIPQVMNSDEKPSLVNSLEIKKEEVCETAKLGDLIQEGIGRVSLTSGVDDVIHGLGSSEVTGSQETETPNNDDDNGVKNDGEKVGGDLEESKDSDSDLEEDDSSSSSSSSSSSDDDEEEEEEEEEDDDDDDDSDDEEESLKGEKKVKSEVEMEEGEIRDFEVEDDDDDDDDDVKGPIRSKNEVQNLPPVPPVTVTIEPHHKTLPVGVILSIMGPQVIVEGVENHNPLSEGSILWITKTRLPLGVVDEIFGPVKNPYYMVRYNSETDIPIGVQLGSPISFVPEFADYVLNNNNLYKKGYDASDIHDEELSDELEFSDDEKEVEYRKMKKLAKRGFSEQKNVNTKKDNKSRNRGGGQRNNIDRRQASPGGGGVPPGFSVGPPPGPPVNFNGPPPGVWSNGFSSMAPPQNMGFFPSGQFMQPNFTQQPFQNLGMPNMGSFHPQFNNAGPMFQPNFGPNPGFGSWPMGLGQNNFNQPQVGPGQSNFNQPQGGPPMGFPGPFMNNSGGGPQGVVMGNGIQMENNGGVRPPFVAGNGETGQNRGGRRMFQRGGGRFRGGGRGGRSGMQSR